jgi:UPF0271 protein
MHLDLNADVGESFGPYTVGHDAGLMRSITSANVAAGVHAGDPSVLRATIRLARSHGVAVGAHPGFPDREGFGRREMRLAADEAEDLVLYQIAAVAGVAASEGLRLQHVKPHGALYNMAAVDSVMAKAVVKAIVAFDPSLIVVGPPASALLDAGRAAGLRIAAEGFADRAYQADGSLLSRRSAGAVISDIDAVVSRAVQIARDRTVLAEDGSLLALPVDTLCIHGDTPRADRLAERVRAGLAAASVTIRPLGLL